jgi:predicted GIY-YIG superfamily endonuclease
MKRIYQRIGELKTGIVDKKNIMATIVYVLKLEDDKYYVGRTCDYERRVREHFEGRGSAWTQMYKPLELYELLEVETGFEEDMVVKEMMSLYGIDNVRGGSYVRVTLGSNERELLEREIKMAMDLCVLCGSEKHFVRDCDAEVVYECEVCGVQFNEKDVCQSHVMTCVKKVSKGIQTDDEKKRRKSMCCVVL